MALNYDSVAAHVRHTLGGDVSTDTDIYDIINNAGEFMTSLYPWRWSEHTETITPSGDVGHLDLSGKNFVELVAFSPRGLDTRKTTGDGVYYAVSLQEIIDKREVAGTGDNAAAYTAVPAGAFYFNIRYYSNKGTAVPVPRMEIFPNSHDDNSSHTNLKGAITLTYRKGWNNISDPDSSEAAGTFVMPEWCEPLYLQCVRAFARGYEEEDVATTNARLTDVMEGPLVGAAIQRDQLIESTTQRVIRRQSPTALAGIIGNNALVN